MTPRNREVARPFLCGSPYVDKNTRATTFVSAWVIIADRTEPVASYDFA